MSVKDRFMKYWRVPKLLSGDSDDRKVTFLELFYDLVFVIYISAINHNFIQNFTLEGFLFFLSSLTIGWWSWYNGSSYHEINGNNDYRSRVTMFIQMFLVIGMIIFMKEDFSEGIAGFAICYALFHIILGYLWYSDKKINPDYYKTAVPYALMMFLSAIVYIISIFVPTTIAAILWTTAIVAQLTTPIIIQFFAAKKNIPNELRLHMTHSMSERFALFTIIVVGEVLVGLVNGFRLWDTVNIQLIGLGLFFFVVVLAIWWSYFDFISLRVPKKRTLQRTLFPLLHLPVATCISLQGILIFLTIEAYSHDSDISQLITYMSLNLGVFLIILGFLELTLEDDLHYCRDDYNAIVPMLFSGICLITLSFFNLNVMTSMILIIIIILIPNSHLMYNLLFGKE